MCLFDNLENLPSQYIIHEGPEATLFTQVEMNAQVIGTPVLLRSSVIAVL